MTIKSKTVSDYISNLPEDRQLAINSLRNVILKNIPEGFVEEMSYGMIGYVIPHTLYPPGYHCSPELPLPFVNIASQKNFIAIYHMGIYGDESLLKWFTNEYPKHCQSKLDMGKSCIRLKKMDQIPYKLIGELMRKITVSDYIAQYEKLYKK
jgi:uncharacterized protein YdhG (YjbR/CyaY superfamily)